MFLLGKRGLGLWGGSSAYLVRAGLVRVLELEEEQGVDEDAQGQGQNPQGAAPPTQLRRHSPPPALPAADATGAGEERGWRARWRERVCVCEWVEKKDE